MRSSLANKPRVGGRYRVERALGEGGMGVVVEVLDETTGERLALKRLRAGTGAQQASLFEREYRTLVGLRHPRVVRAHAYGVDEAGPYYTMELLAGADLSERAPMPWREVCACLRDAASILGLLHARQMLHRDLTPRNLWQTPDGRLKLLDFGALAPFGPPSEVIGTPAFVAPEVLGGRPLDQRADLFALGALGYWLLTGTHAFRATQFAELPRLWQTLPAAPSSLARLVHGADRTIPQELDAIILSLLRVDPDERPRSTGEVVSRLNAVGGLAPEPEDVVIHGYLDSGAFVGRRRERARFAAALAQASLGGACSLLLEGPEGAGRTRMLGEYATTARLAGALVLVAEVSAGAPPYHAALSLARGLVEALPAQARIAASEHAGVLGAWAPPLREALGDAPAPAAAPDALADRLRTQVALAAWMHTIARYRTLVILADDLDRVDEESLALLITLAHAEGEPRILIVGACRTHHGADLPPSLRPFAAAAERLPLAPLTTEETRILLRSTFGDVPYLDRASARLHAVSKGLPAHLQLLARHLVAAGHARYAHGGWQLPSELPHDLPHSLRDGLLATLEAVPEEQRELLAVASLSEHCPLGAPALASLLGWTHARVEDAVSELVARRLLEATRAGLSLAHPALRERLARALPGTRRAHLHQLLAALSAGDPDPAAQVRAALHELRAGQRSLAEARLLAVIRPMLAGSLPYSRAVAHMFEEALSLVRDAGGDSQAQAPLLSVLAMASYQVDRNYARFGEDALAALEHRLRFDVARRLRPYLGGLFALLTALLFAFLRGRRRAGVGVREAATWLVTVLGYLMGPASLSLDRARLERYAATLEPLLALGKDHAVHLAHLFSQGLILGIEDRASAAQEAMARVMARLRSDRPIRALPEGNRRNLLAAAAYACGLREASACDPHLLQIADELAAGSPMHAIQADLLRSVYFTYVGDLEQAKGYERQVERRAIQLGTAWQAELLGPRLQCRAALWTHDYARHKRGAHALARLSEETPSFARSARWAAGTDLVFEGRFEEAFSVLETHDEPLRELGWVGVQATLAQAYNATGRYALAKQRCEHALAHLQPEDRAFVILYLPAEVELCIADAGLGDGLRADERIAELLIKHVHTGPLVLGYLHGARARMAFLRRDLADAERHLSAMEQCYRPTHVPSLLAHCANFRDQLLRGRHPSLTSGRPMAPDDRHLLTRVGLIMTQELGSREARAAAALKVAVDLSRAGSGAVLFPEEASPATVFGTPPSTEVLAWAYERLREAQAEEERTALLSEDDAVPDYGEAYFEDQSHRVVVLWRRDGHLERPVAALLLSSASGMPEVPVGAVLRVLGERLVSDP